MDKQMCAGCRAGIQGKKFMVCHGCSQNYDLQCANLSPKRYKAMNDEVKRGWRCLECHSKVPKSDNTNTPVRSSGLPKTSGRTESDVEYLTAASNVTLRRGQSPTGNYITEDRLKEFLKTEKQDIRDIIEKCTKGLSDQLEAIKTECAGYHESLSFMSTQYEELRKEIVVLKKLLGSSATDLKSVKDENKALKDTLQTQSAKIKFLEEENMRQQQWSRMQNIEVTGIPEDKDENALDIITRVINHVGVPIQASDIEFAHRVQPRRSGGAARARAFVVRLKQRSLKDHIVAAARKYRVLRAKDLGIGGDDNRIFINDHLTKDNKMLLNASKQKAKDVGFKYIWTKNCRIYVRRNETSPPILISCSADLSKIV